MKTLDEVIKAFELSCGKKDCGQCPYDEDCLDHHVCECYERMNDVLHYLKEYQEKRKTLEIRTAEYKRGFEQLAIEWSRIKDNSPLSWDELKQMEGKPVWVESHGSITEFTGWTIVSNVLPDRVHFIFSHYDGDFLAYEMSVPKEQMGIRWQAYRKERNENA